MREKLHARKTIRLLGVGRNAEFGENIKALIHGGGARSEAGSESIGIPAEEICKEFGEFVVVCGAFVEDFDGCSDYGDFDDAGDAYSISAF